MHRTLIILALATGATSSVSAQGWNVEVGIQGGYTRVKPAGTGRSDHVDLFGLPGDLFGVIPSTASLFVILPTSRRLAFETTVSALRSSKFTLIGDATFVTFGARGDYAITRSVYAAAGSTLQWFDNSSQSDTQLGLLTAFGVRFPLLARLRGRVEASALFLEHTARRSPADVYAITFGVSKEAGARHRAAGSDTRQPWEPSVGLQGGYSFANVVGGTDVSSFTLPGVGGAFTILATPAGPPTLFAILPLEHRVALEPGLDFHRLQSQGLTIFDVNSSLRLNYAITQGVYVAIGGNLVYLKGSGFDAQMLTGANLAGGYRRPLTAGLGARVELSYIMMKKNDSIPFPAVNTVSVQAGVTLPVR